METGQRIQTETRRDAEEVKTISSVQPVLTRAIAAICLLFIATATAQTNRAPVVIKEPKDFHRYALYCPKPEYPINLRERRIGGSGTFMLHLRQDGTVESVETLISTGHAELDDIAKSAFIKWRFRSGPTEAKVPITFKRPNGGRAEWPFAR
jgi:TonB family protein